jgi:uncharacterized protein
MKLFTTKETKALQQLLACAVDQDTAFSLESLHGFLFGLAAIPEVVLPSEWLPCVFGEEMIEVADEQAGNRLLAPLFLAYNRMVAQSNQGELYCPFDIGKLKTADIDRIRQWCYGFFHAINLRPQVWGFPDEDDAEVGAAETDENASDDDQEMTACMSVLMGIAFPERIPELFEDRPSGSGQELRQAKEQEAKFFVLLPQVIETFQEVARTYGEMRQQVRKAATVHPLPVRREAKIGRNDPCPCGSGKKFKKCCGVN